MSTSPLDFAALDFVPVPAGRITMRDARTDSSRDVALREFSIVRTPVTWSQYISVTGESIPAGEPADAPVHSVSWFQAVAWCNAASELAGLAPAYQIDGNEVSWRVDAAGIRLPTEAEWEWACRAGTGGPGYGPLEAIAWTATDDVSGVQPVGRKQPNDFGLFDMLGNVWEWCWDYADPARYADYRGFRGGGWADKPWSVRASVRRGSMPDAALDDLGFRVAKGAVGEAGTAAAQGWSEVLDQERADSRGGATPFGWTRLQHRR
ncbi:formylglycine-generating enzyme required for sulfatase activity [Stackebrandtia endophytica]|uniref:Formylglycine-generating enzyme required for sulfatase activity n=1 Tax=Stackebrandtia endophytica TaxID=1496996 RepID=A0A543AQG9_9ACTN|nr:SUMF1/EgtB/PvdO family nonheme iron enzyme [Stackebrandtia endophytica]TQL74804.1 formylglycine-generating enzyme required for sulfatase activity [Stackebrandtia endophytica]